MSANRTLPSVDALLRSHDFVPLIDVYGRHAVTNAIRSDLSERRANFDPENLPTESEILIAVSTRLARSAEPNLRPVLNLTGTVIHTNLGRAPLADDAMQAVQRVGSQPVNLEYDLSRGRRGSRDTHVEELICELTGAEAAIAVNNNAAAVLLLLSALARRKEVLVSRGELIEIGGSFRMPDIMKSAGCKLVEVGTTNRTHLRDFAEAMSDKTAMVMKVHMANYKIDGFTADVSEPDLAKLCQDQNVPFVVDLGSGTLINFSELGLPHEPTPQEALKNGADVVTFSGDKLLGGPQAGIICGRADLVKKIARHPMKRAVRLDKLMLAALEATLRLYRDPDRLMERLPVLQLLTRPVNDIANQAVRLLPHFEAALTGEAMVETIDVQSQVGSGSLPVDRLPSVAIALSSARKSGRALDRLAARFRSLPRPVIGRISDGKLVFDLRCLSPEKERILIEQLPQMKPPAT